MGFEMGLGSESIDIYSDDSRKFAHYNRMFELDEYFVLGHRCRCGLPLKYQAVLTQIIIYVGTDDVEGR